MLVWVLCCAVNFFLASLFLPLPNVFFVFFTRIHFHSVIIIIGGGASPVLKPLQVHTFTFSMYTGARTVNEFDAKIENGIAINYSTRYSFKWLYRIRICTLRICTHCIVDQIIVVVAVAAAAVHIKWIKPVPDTAVCVSRKFIEKLYEDELWENLWADFDLSDSITSILFSILNYGKSLLFFRSRHFYMRQFECNFLLAKFFWMKLVLKQLFYGFI